MKKNGCFVEIFSLECLYFIVSHPFGHDFGGSVFGNS